MNTLRIRTIISLFVAFVVSIFAVGFFTPTAAAADCPLTFEEPADVFNYAQDGTLEFSSFEKQNGQTAITVTNNSDCELPLALGSYEMMAGNQLSDQQLHDEHRQVVPAQSSRTLKVDLPSCMAQIDLYHDPNEDGVPTPPEPANAKLIGFTFNGNEKDIFAENDIFHFSDGHPYKDLDDFPNDDDDGYRNAQPAEGFRYCDQPAPTKLTIIKKVHNVGDRDVTPADFSISADPHTGNSPSFNFPGSSDGTTRSVSPIRYDLNETGPDGVEFSSSYSGDCRARSDGDGGKVTPDSGSTAVCTITNTLKDDTTNQCPYENNRLPIEEPADLFEFAQDGTLEFSQFNKTNGQAAISITNNSNCEFPVSLGVYEMFDNTFENQELFSEDTTVVNGNSQATVSAELPACMAQIDLLYDPDQDGPPETPSSANPNLIGFTFNQNEEDVFAENDVFHFSDGHPYEDLDNFPNDDDDSPRNAGPAANFCPSQPPEPEPPTCPFTQGDGNGEFDYVVNFADALSRGYLGANGPTKSDNINLDLTSGTYNLSLFGWDDSRGADHDRSTQNQPIEKWFLHFSNDTGFSVESDSTDDLADDSQLATNTTQMAIELAQETTKVQARHHALKVTGSYNANSLVPECVGINKVETDPLTGTCSVDPDDPETGQTVTWSSSASGGTGNYTYSWSGDANGTTSSVNETYQTSGQKTATVSINDGDSTITRTCRVSVSDNDNGDDPTRLTIIKKIANRDGRDVSASDFTISANPHVGNSPSYSFPGSSSGVTRDVASIRYNLSEAGPSNIDYDTTYSGNCTARNNSGGRVTPKDGQTATCTITNTLEEKDDDDSDNGGSGGGGAVLDPRDDDDDDGEVRGEQDPDFSVQCEPKNNTYLIGQQVTFDAAVSGDADNDDVTFDWKNGSELDANTDQATAQYLSAGTKSVTVTAEYDDVTESDVCSVDIRAAADQGGVRLNQLPYTGPGSAAETVAFGLLILLIATSGSYLALRRFRSDGIPVGIPQDGKRE